MTHDVFISHASQDKVIADAVVTALETEKIRCWLAPRDIRSGEHWAAEINNAIKSTKIMVLIFSESSNQSDQVVNEITLSVKSKVTVIPFKIEDVLPQGVMEYYLAATHWLDAMNPPTEKQIAKLVETVKNALGIRVEEEATSITPEKEVPVITEKTLKREEDIIAINKKTGLMAVALLASLLLLFGGYKLLNPAAEDPNAQIDSPAGSEQTAPVGSEKSQASTVTPVSSESKGEIIVTSTADYGDGSLRLALQTARSGDTIIFDPAVFPPANPQAITIYSALPALAWGNMTIDASNAGVIIDGAEAQDTTDYLVGLHITSSENTIMGLQIINCFSYNPQFEGDSGAAIKIESGASNNIIGGDRSVGSGPLGQGNLFSGCNYGMDIGDGASYNIIKGNLIGTDLSGTAINSNSANFYGIIIGEGANNNIVGPDNIIAFNHIGVSIGEPIDHFCWREGTVNNTVTGNKIFNNRDKAITLLGDANNYLVAPRISSVDLNAGTVSGNAFPNSMVEIFSDSGRGGEIFEGSTEADNEGDFVFSAGRSFSGPFITATATDADGNTSEFSAPAK